MKAVAVDFEFSQEGGELPQVVSMATFDGEVSRTYWMDEILSMDHPPPELRDALVVTWFQTAECVQYLTLGWKLPVKIIDMYVYWKQYRLLRALWNTGLGNGLIDAVEYFRLRDVDKAYKNESRDIIIDNYPDYTDDQRVRILDYNAQDAVDTFGIYTMFLEDDTNLDQYLHYGDYSNAVARMEWRGVSIDQEMLVVVCKNNNTYKEAALEKYQDNFNFFDTTNSSISWTKLFKYVTDRKIRIKGFGDKNNAARLNHETMSLIRSKDKDLHKDLVDIQRCIATGDRAKLLTYLEEYPFLLMYKLSAPKLKRFIEDHGMGKVWPLTDTGKYSQDKGTFQEMSKTNGMDELRIIKSSILGTTDFSALTVGKDGRNRTLLSPFSTKTGRHAWSTKKFVYALAYYGRTLIQAPKGRCIIEIDYKSEEIAVAAYLSEDENMVKMYNSADPYLEFGKQAGIVPQDATKDTHKTARQICKAIVLGLGYGMGALKLASRAGCSVQLAKYYIAQHKDVYKKYWKFSKVVVETIFNRPIFTPLNWGIMLDSTDRENTGKNFPVQATASDVLRAAVVRLDAEMYEMTATIHDAVQFELDVDDPEFQAKIDRAEIIMQEASKAVLGHTVKTDVDILQPGEHWHFKLNKNDKEILRLLLQDKINLLEDIFEEAA